MASVLELTTTLVTNQDGSAALWLNQYRDGRKVWATLNDENTETVLRPDEDIDELVAAWKASFEAGN